MRRREPLTDLAPHLAETGPAQLQLRRRPLQEGRAIRIRQGRVGPKPSTDMI